MIGELDVELEYDTEEDDGVRREETTRLLLEAGDGPVGEWLDELVDNELELSTADWLLEQTGLEGGEDGLEGGGEESHGGGA